MLNKLETMFKFLFFISLGIVMGQGEKLRISEGVIFQRLAGVRFFNNRHIISMGISKDEVYNNFGDLKRYLVKLEKGLDSLNLSANLKPRAGEILHSLISISENSFRK